MTHTTTVLVVDDQETYDFMAPILAEELKTINVLHRDSEEGALELLRSHQPLDMIFCDWDTAGPYFIAAVRNDPETHFTPLIVMSDTDRDDIIADAMRAGASDHMAKPFLSKGLIAKVRRITKNRERRRLRRIRPQGPWHVRAALGAGDTIDLELVDISSGGCQTRAPLDLCRRVCIYQDSAIVLCGSDDVCIDLGARIMRLSQDIEPDAAGKTILVAFEFTDLGASSDALYDMLDHLREHWSRDGRSGDD